MKKINHGGFRRCLLLAFLTVLFSVSDYAAGLNWPVNQLLPTFSTPAPVLDCIDVSSASDPEIDLFASLEGIVNRTQPKIACVSSGDGEGEFTWLGLHNLSYNMLNGYAAISKYQSNLTGLVVTDPNQPDTLNLATTIAGVNNQLICDPSLLATLTNTPYNLPIGVDLRGLFANKYQVYGYLYTNYWPQCTHRVITGLYTNLHGNLRDYAVAVKSAVVWLDPGTLNFSDKSTLALFLANMSAAQSLYMGWWPNEGNGLSWIAQYGVPVLASDYFRNGSVFSGVSQPINVPDIPPAPPLQNKVYVSLIFSDGDNVQYMQHVMKMWWGNTARGSIPVGWTATALAAEFDPMMFNYYWSTATTNDCLISGPCGAGYTHMENWSAANLAAYTRLSDSYLQRSGLRIITIWDSVSTGIAQSYATNCPTLLGLTDQSGGTYISVNLGLRTMGLTVAYSSATNDIISGLTNAAKTWTGTAPMFLAAQADTWNLTPPDLATIASALDTNKYVLVRPDHLFMLYNRVFGLPQAVTEAAIIIDASRANLRGMVTPNATNASAWIEWGTNGNYGSRSLATNVGLAGAVVPVTAAISGLATKQIYHYRAVASNALGMAWGADRQFTTGGNLKAWGNTSLGETNVPVGMTNVVGIAAGANHGLGLKNDGTVVAWGDDTYGQTNVPAGLTNVIQVAAGQYHSLALKTDGTVAAWGNNIYGQTNVPVGLSNVVAIAAGANHNLALKTDQTLTAWGNNGNGQTNIPAGLINVVDMTAGQSHSLALKADGTVKAWGLNNFGQTNVPAALDHVVALAAGQYHSVALKANGISAPNIFPACKWVADSLSVTNGALVANWTDSIHQKVASQVNMANQPQLVTNVLSGHNIVRFAAAGSQCLAVATNDSPISSATDFTLIVVFQTTAPGLVSGLFYQNTGLLGCEQPNTVADWALGINGSQLGAGLGAGSTGCGSDVSMYGGNVTDGKPHIAVYARSGGTVRLYVDGVIVSEQNSLCTAARGNYSFQIGAMTAGSGFFSGDIAEIQLYNRALSAWEMTSVNQLLATTYGMAGIAGAPMTKWVADTLSGSDGSSVSNWTDVFGNKNAVQNSAANRPKLYSNVMNGHKVVRLASASSQYLTVAAANSPLSAAGSFTLVMVFKTTMAGASSSSFYSNTGLLGAEQSGVVADWALCINGSQLGAGLGGGANGCGADLSLYGGSVTDGNPHVAMYVRAGDTITLYLDGVRVAAQSALCPATRGNYNFQIGAMTAGTLCFSGDIAEIQLYNRALNSWEMMSVNEILAATYGVGGAAGTVVVWGNTANGLANVPKNLTNVTSVVAGSAFNLAINGNCTVTGWGNNSQGQTNLPPGLTNVAAVAGGTAFGLAIGNQPPTAGSATISGYVDHDLAFALPATDPDGNPLNFHILSLPVSGALYQYSNGVRGPAIITANTLVSDPSGQVVFAPAAGETGNPYANFNFMVDDGLFVSGTAQVAVNIGLPAVPQFTGISWNPDISGAGGLDLNFSGASNATYSVWSSADLANWSKIGTATEANPGLYEFLDSTATNQPQQFYRISSGR